MRDIQKTATRETKGKEDITISSQRALRLFRGDCFVSRGCFGFSCPPPPSIQKCTNIHTQGKLRIQLFKMMYVEWEDGQGMCTVEPRYNEVLGKTNEFLYPSHSKIYEKEPPYSEHILPVPWPFVKSMFHCSSIRTACIVCLEFVNERP